MIFFRRRSEDRTLPENYYPGIQPVWPGETLPPQRALRVSDVFACVRVLADSAASLPLIPYRRLENGRTRVSGGRLPLLLDRPAPATTQANLVSQAMAHLTLHGNAFLGKFRDSEGRIEQLAMLHPDHVQVEVKAGQPRYTVTGSNGEQAVLLSGGFQADEARVGDPKILLAAGDIAECPTTADEATAKILGRFPEATIATLGDNAYPDASAANFEDCFEPSWGKHKERIRPATGNHDFATKDAAGYFDYSGEAGGEFDKYYYSYDLGAWHVVVLNSDCWRVDGCDLDDPQIEWLRRDLASNARFCWPTSRSGSA